MGLRERATDEAQLFYGINGHDYVVSRLREPVEEVARAIGRKTGVYYKAKYMVWALRIRSKQGKEAVRRLFGRGENYENTGINSMATVGDTDSPGGPP
jgi:hypothetical protein